MKNNINIEKIQEQLLSKVDEFANKVAPIYKILNWTWTYQLDGSDKHIPSSEEIKSVLIELINDLKIFKTPGMGTGGLMVGYEYNPKNSLSFKIYMEMKIESNWYQNPSDYLLEK